MADVFISYKRDQRSIVETLAERLRGLGLSTWFDASLSAGETFSDEIDREARDAKCILVCWSPEARESRWVRAEAMIGFDHDKLAAAYIDGPDGFYAPAPFNSAHAEDLRTWLRKPDDSHSGWRSLLRRLGKLAERPDLQSWGSLDVQATERELRTWLDSYPTSPVLPSVEEMLRVRTKQDAERIKREQEASLQRERETAERERNLAADRDRRDAETAEQRAAATRERVRRETERHEQERLEAIRANERRFGQLAGRAALFIALTAFGIWGITLLLGLGASTTTAETTAYITSSDFAASNSLSPRPQTQEAPTILIEDGACPGEGCSWNHRWLAQRNVQAYRAPPDALAVDLRSLAPATEIAEGTWTVAVNGRMISRRADVVVTEAVAALDDSPALARGQVIAVYNYVGEGCYRTWIELRIHTVCARLEQFDAPAELWVQLRLTDNSLVWVHPQDDAFISQENLDTELASVLADANFAVEWKIDRVDALIARGANINGDGGMYGYAPAGGAVASNDPRVLQAMISRGLDLSRGCPANEALSHINKDRFDIMLDALLANSMRIECLSDHAPAATQYLTFGIELREYNVQNAMNVARVLASHGIPLSTPDSEGQTIFDRLNSVRNNPSRLAPLRTELERLVSLQRTTE